MSRLASLAYYFFAWVFGCFFMALAIQLMARNPFQVLRAGASRLVVGYFFGMAFAALPALLFAFVLMRFVRLRRLDRSWQWAAAGAAITPLFVWLLYAVVRLVEIPGPPLLRLVLFGGATAAVGFGRQPVAATLSLLLAGAATAFVLFYVERAYRPAPADADCRPAESR